MTELFHGYLAKVKGSRRQPVLELDTPLGLNIQGDLVANVHLATGSTAAVRSKTIDYLLRQQFMRAANTFLRGFFGPEITRSL